MVSIKIPAGKPFDDFQLSVGNRLVSVYIPFRDWLRLNPTQRYILDVSAHVKYDSNKLCRQRNYDRRDWNRIVELLCKSKIDWASAAFEAWIEFDAASAPPTELRLPHPAAGPHFPLKWSEMMAADVDLVEMHYDDGMDDSAEFLVWRNLLKGGTHE